ncbi:MFS transporter [Streptomyces sp. NPDC005760]|uniref:MFS transporter n=1 Tax=Streptomyces sp. NPDC005760 TaxID=3156718 RepID=UPI0033D652F0
MTVQGSPVGAGPVTDPKRAEAPQGWWPLIAIVLAVTMLMLDTTVVVVALPDMQRDLHASLTDAQWILNAFTLTLACFQLTSGFLGDRLGRRQMFMGGVLAFGAASVACGLAGDAGFLIAARAVQGAAGSVIFATTLALIAQCYEGKARGTAFGIRGSAAGAVVVISPLLGGALVSSLNWRWIFFINVPVVIAVMAIAWIKIPRQVDLRTVQKMDTGGLVTLTVALFLLTFALLRGESYGWSSTRVLIMLSTAAVALVAFLLIERRHPDPMLDLTLFRSGTFSATQIATFCTNASFFGLLVYLSLYFQNQLGYSPMKVGLCFLTVNIPILLAGPVAGTFMDRLPARVLPTVGLLLIGTGLIMMHGIGADDGVRELVPGMIAVGFGLGLALPALGALAMEVADARRLGMAAGVNTTANQVGMTLAIAVYGALIQSQVHSSLSRALAGQRVPVDQLADVASEGRITSVAGALDEAVRETVVRVAHDAFLTGLNHLMYVAAGLALAGALVTVLFVRTPATRAAAESAPIAKEGV